MITGSASPFVWLAAMIVGWPSTRRDAPVTSTRRKITLTTTQARIFRNR